MDNRFNASVGLALSMGCFMAVIAVGSLFLGLAIDRSLFPNAGNTRIATLVCVLGSIPLSLVSALFLTRLLLSRMIPPDKRKPSRTDGTTASVNRSVDQVDQDDDRN